MSIVGISIIVVCGLIEQADNNGEIFAGISIIIMLVSAFMVIEKKIDNYGKK